MFEFEKSKLTMISIESKRKTIENDWKIIEKIDLDSTKQTSS